MSALTTFFVTDLSLLFSVFLLNTSLSRTMLLVYLQLTVLLILKTLLLFLLTFSFTLIFTLSTIYDLFYSFYFGFSSRTFYLGLLMFYYLLTHKPSETTFYLLDPVAKEYSYLTVTDFPSKSNHYSPMSFGSFQSGEGAPYERFVNHLVSREGRDILSPLTPIDLPSIHHSDGFPTILASLYPELFL